MKLIPEQVQNIRCEILAREQEKIMFDEYYDDQKALGGTDQELNCIVKDETINFQNHQNKTRLEELKNILLTGEYVKKINTDQIDIGTKFYLEFEGEEKEKYTLVDTKECLSSINGFISKDSPLGKSIYGKKENEEFSIKTQYGIETGMIKEIIQDPKEYSSFITTKQKTQRSSKEYKRTHSIMLKDKEKYKEELEKEDELIPEQIQILKEEVFRLERFVEKYKNSPKSKEYYSMASRLAYILDLLDNVKIAEKPADNTIGVGSSFSVMLFDEETSFHRYQLINHAVSDELTDEFIEKISPLGTKVFGLKENEEFVVRKDDNSWVSGIVYDIDNSKNQIKTTDPLVYQKQRGLKSRRLGI